MAIQVPFLAQKLYTGPLTERLGGADISWLVGLAVTFVVYYAWARRTANPPSRMIQDLGDELATTRPAAAVRAEPGCSASGVRA